MYNIIISICKLKVKYSPRYLKGFGLSDGEVMERLWSHMRRFSRMTKEMRPSHRIDVLTDALMYFAQKADASLGKSYILCKNAFATLFAINF